VHEHFTAAILGLVEGLTEFLPVSSTGHLIVVAHAMGYEGLEANTFNVFIQLGAMLAVVLYFRSVFAGLFRPAAAHEGFGGPRAAMLLALTTLPALVVGKLAHDVIKAQLFEPSKVAIGLVIGSVWIVLTEKFCRQDSPRDLGGLDWRTALGIGLFQCVALWPGVSRSAATILGAMILGLNRKAATEYSFFAAVPIIVVATSYDIVVNWPIIRPEAVPYFTTGFLVAFISAWMAIKFFIRFVSRHSLQAFAGYRLAVAALIFALM
jgi:undecaprenyl-diphosphatase